MLGFADMTTRTKRILIVAISVVLIGCSVAGWATVKIVAWARDLPNRIQIDGDAMATAFGTAMVESYHHVLRDGDAPSQVDVLSNQFIPYATSDEKAAKWIRDEYGDDIQGLVTSDAPAVSTAATNLLALLNAEAEIAQP
jgi:hypothetical protein